MGFSVEEMKVVHARLSDIIATSGKQLDQMTGVLDFVTSISDEDQLMLANAANTARNRRRGCDQSKSLSPSAEKAECLRLYAEIEAKMGRVWMKKHDLQVAKRMLEMSA